jgi:2-aminobenzoate-CoA ligase
MLVRDLWAGFKAYVVLRGEAAGDLQLKETLQGLVRDQVGRHASPREFEFVTVLPRTESGKIQRALLRERAATESIPFPSSQTHDGDS